MYVSKGGTGDLGVGVEIRVVGGDMTTGEGECVGTALLAKIKLNLNKILK